MTSLEYQEYMKSQQWQERRLAKLEHAKFKCEKCGERNGLEVHHKTYERLGHEKSSDLIVLCKACHWIADEDHRGNNKIKAEYEAKREKDRAQFVAEATDRQKHANIRKKLREQSKRKKWRLFK